MFSKLSVFALAVPMMASALQLAIPENPTSSGTITIKWTNQPGDPDTWSFELTNQAFNKDFAIANTVNPSASSITITLPVVPVGSGYTLQAVNIGNITDVFAETPEFSIGAATTPVSTAASTTASSASASHSTSASVISTGSPSTTPSATVTNNGFSSNIVTPSVTAPTTAPTAGTTSGSSPSGSTTPGSTFSGASRLSIGGSASGFAAVVLSAVAGAAMIAL